MSQNQEHDAAAAPSPGAAAGDAPGGTRVRDTSMARNIVGVLCPYCACVSSDIRRCHACGGYFDPLSRQASQNDMGPWFLYDKDHPTRPGCSYEKIRELARLGKVRPGTIIRGPTTKQFWTFASRAPSIANLVGFCHNCQGKASGDDYSCKGCGAVFAPETDRQHLGLAPVRLLPGRNTPAAIASRELGPEPAAAIGTPAIESRVIEPKASATAGGPRNSSGESDALRDMTRPLPGSAFLPPLAESVAASEVLMPSEASGSGPTTRRSAATDAALWSDDGTTERASGGWWWIAIAAMLLLASGIGYIAWSQGQPGVRPHVPPVRGIRPNPSAPAPNLQPSRPSAGASSSDHPVSGATDTGGKASEGEGKSKGRIDPETRPSDDRKESSLADKPKAMPAESIGANPPPTPVWIPESVETPVKEAVIPQPPPITDILRTLRDSGAIAGARNKLGELAKEPSPPAWIESVRRTLDRWEASERVGRAIP